MVERDKQYSACQLIINIQEAEPDRSGHLPTARGLQSPDCVLITDQLRVLGPDYMIIFTHNSPAPPAELLLTHPLLSLLSSWRLLIHITHHFMDLPPVRFTTLRDLVDLLPAWRVLSAYVLPAIRLDLYAQRLDHVPVQTVTHLYVYKPLQYTTDRQISPGLNPSLLFSTSLSPTT